MPDRQRTPPNRVFPFFVGSGRSGTTLLQMVFDEHEELAVAHEAHFVAALANRRRSYRSGSDFLSQRFLDDLFSNPNFVRIGVPREAVSAGFAAHPPGDFPDAVRQVLGIFAARQGKPLYGDKTPGYVKHIPLLASLFPESKFIHIIRDGRDVALGYMGQDWGPSTVTEAAHYWRNRVGTGRIAGGRLGPDRYREVKYESLVLDPEAIVRELCGFLTIDFLPSMLRYHERGDALRRMTAHPDAHARLVLPPTPGLRNWRRDMSPEDVRIFEAISGGLLEELGYELSGSLTVRLRASAVPSWFGWQLARARARAQRPQRRP